MLIVLVVMLIVLIMLIVLVVTNILSHVHALTPYGDHSPSMGVVSGLMVGANVLTYFLRLSDVVLCKSELSRMLL